MKNIEIEEELYQYIASQTQFIGESATSILRRLLLDKPTETTIVEDNSLEPTELVDSVNNIEVNDDVPAVEKEHEQTVEPLVTDTLDVNESVFNYINKEELAMQRGAVGRFLLILSALYRVHSQKFSVVSDIRGRDRLYFSSNLNELTESGSSTKPFQIPDSPYWVVTNSNTTRKKMILTKVATALGYNESEAENIRELL